MKCPHCDEQAASTYAIFQDWCPNCGCLITLKKDAKTVDRLNVPILVQRSGPGSKRREHVPLVPE